MSAVDIDSSNRYIAVGTTHGECVIINIKSGGIIYKLESKQKSI